MDPEENWKWLWKLKVASKIIHFIWLLRLEKLLTNKACYKRGCNIDPHCKWCSVLEDTKHIFMDCNHAMEVWNGVYKSISWKNNNTIFLPWIEENLKLKNDNLYYGLPWNILFASVLWNIWLSRNDFQFNGNDQNWTQVVIKIIDFAKATCNAFNNNLGISGKIEDSLIKWHFPIAGRFKLNTDGSCLSAQGYASFGRLAQNDQGMD